MRLLRITRKELNNIVSTRAKEYNGLNLKGVPKELNENLNRAFAVGFRDCIIWINKKEIADIKIKNSETKHH